MTVFLLVLGLISFVGLVVVHEFGHFIVAKKNGVDVEEFGVGFPPKAKTLAVKDGTEYTLNWLPLGGFVRLKGENDSDTRPGTYGASSLKTKVKIMLAGVTMNLITAFILLTIAAWVGLPKLVPNQFTVSSDTKEKSQLLVAFVAEDSPAKSAGLKTSDEIIKIESAQESYEAFKAEELPEITKDLAGENVVIKVKRQAELVDLELSLRTEQEVSDSKDSDQPKGYLGIVPADYTVRKSTWSAPIVASGLIAQFTELTLSGIGNSLSDAARGNGKEASEQVAGPVGIFFAFKQGSQLGYEFILFLVALISLTLAIFNTLPIPALDGGRLFVTLLFKAIKKPLTKEREDLIHGLGFMALMGLFVLITVVDVQRFF
jgi:regulator of sigma E protease